jgi:hypothetical protein
MQLGGTWRSMTANERVPWEGASRRRLGSDQIGRWWQNELALTAAPCFQWRTGDGHKNRIFFTIFSITDRMHRLQ